MLILSRKPGEKIIIGENVSVSIIEVRGDQVKIGVEAPRAVKVFREEVFKSIQEANKEAAASAVNTNALSSFAAAINADRKE